MTMVGSEEGILQSGGMEMGDEKWEMRNGIDKGN